MEEKKSKWPFIIIGVLILILLLGGGGGYKYHLKQIAAQKEAEKVTIDSLTMVMNDRDSEYDELYNTIDAQTDEINRIKYENYKERKKRIQLENLIDAIRSKQYNKLYLDSIADYIKYE